MPSTGYVESTFDLVLTYGRVFYLEGWTVEPRSTGTRFTNDETGRGMFVTIESVSPCNYRVPKSSLRLQR